MGIFSVESSGETRKKTIVFKIAKFAELLNMSNKELEENGIIFEAGNCTLKDGTVTWFGGFLVLHRPTDKSSVKSASASWSVKLSSKDFKSMSFSAQRTEFGGASGSRLGRSYQLLATESELRQKIKGNVNVVEVTLLVEVFSDRSSKVVLGNPSPNSEQLRGQMISDLVKMLGSGDGADVEVKVPSEAGGEVNESSHTKKAHRCILMSRSSVFAKMFAKDSTMTEAQTGKVVIKDLSPKGLDVFLHYLNTGEVLQDWGQVGSEILNAAEKYDCGHLKQYCGLNILDAVTTSNALELYKVAKLHKLSVAKRAIVDFIRDNTKAVLDCGEDEDDSEEDIGE